MGLFGKADAKPPKDALKEWTGKVRKEGRVLDRQIYGIQREEEKVKRQLKAAAKKGDKDVCLILGKEIVRSRKAVSKIYTAKAELKSVEMSMHQQMAVVKVSGAMEKSAQVMASMQKLVNVPAVMQSMREMSKEMMRAGIIEEMLEDTMEDALGGDELEDEAEEEVDKVLWELTAGQLGKAPAAVTDSLPVPAEAEGATAAAEEDHDLDDMQSRLEMLRS